MIVDFIIDKMSGYVAGGMRPETAARSAIGELSAIYRGRHWSRDTAGVMRPTPPPENIAPEEAGAKCRAAVNEILKHYKENAGKGYTHGTAPEKPRTIYEGSEALKHTLAAGIGIKDFFAKTKDNDPSAYTTDPEKIAIMWNQGQRRFKAFVRGRFLAIDVDRKPGKPDGLENFYRLFPRETLPEELRNLPDSFPVFTVTPSNGFHLFFRYEGPELKLRELAPCVEIKEFQITAPGSRRENGDYVLHGELNDAPPLYGLIIDAIGETKCKKEQAKAERSKPRIAKAAADRPAPVTHPWITLDDLANEAVSAHGGHHDRQVSFAGRACRCKFSGAETLSYVKSRHDVFGNDTDTENTVMSVFRNYGAA